MRKHLFWPTVPKGTVIMVGHGHWNSTVSASERYVTGSSQADRSKSVD